MKDIDMQNESQDTGNQDHMGMMVALARMGLEVVPRYVMHGQYGPGILYMNGEGVRYEPFNKNHPTQLLTWEEFDNGVDCTEQRNPV